METASGRVRGVEYTYYLRVMPQSTLVDQTGSRLVSTRTVVRVYIVGASNRMAEAAKVEGASCFTLTSQVREIFQ